MGQRGDSEVVITLVVVILVGMFLFGSCYAYPKWRVWQQSLSGEAELRRQEFAKKIAIEEAKAKLESAALLAKAEVERSKGVAEANKIIGDSLKGNDAYLRYLWIQGLQDGTSEVIYVPTEAQLPILEAGKR